MNADLLSLIWVQSEEMRMWVWDNGRRVSQMGSPYDLGTGIR
jgi:hypothetical protein